MCSDAHSITWMHFKCGLFVCTSIYWWIYVPCMYSNCCYCIFVPPIAGWYLCLLGNQTCNTSDILSRHISVHTSCVRFKLNANACILPITHLRITSHMVGLITTNVNYIIKNRLLSKSNTPGIPHICIYTTAASLLTLAKLFVSPSNHNKIVYTIT